MTELALIQKQIKKEAKIKGHAFVRWSAAQEHHNATPKTLGEALRWAKTQR